MPTPASSTQQVQFGVFELDLQRAELRKQGVKVKLQEQPLKVLQVLLETPGQIISREELRQRIWPANTFVEFDQGLYGAMARLRDALGDSSDSPRFIETVARRGYRFIAPVTIAHSLPDTQRREETAQTARGPHRVDFRRLVTSMLAGLFGGALLLIIVFIFDIGGTREWLRRSTVKSVQLERITDFVGVKESPAISPDSKTVAFVAPVNGRKQIWIRLLAGGSPLQLTHDDADHETPRWTPDSSSLIYFAPNLSPAKPGTIWEVSALGGVARRVASAMSGGDISHDGQRIVAFQLRGADLALVAISLDGTIVREIKHFPKLYKYDWPRWSPDDRWIGYVRGWNYAFDFLLQVIPAEGGQARDVAHGDILRGFSWLPDSFHLVYSSSSGSTILYPPIFNLRIASRTGEGDRQLTFGEVSYVEPDVVAGRLSASRVRIQSDVWSFPVSGSPQQNTKDALRITHQTGQAQTPSVSPDGKEFVYLSDSGGHGNLVGRDHRRSENSPNHVRARSFRRDRRSHLVSSGKRHCIHPHSTGEDWGVGGEFGWHQSPAVGTVRLRCQLVS
jgi:DNA-binding winged helix-turn-helix (wHTH) protein/Tol biopolymer transport system component